MKQQDIDLLLKIITLWYKEKLHKRNDIRVEFAKLIYRIEKQSKKYPEWPYDHEPICDSIGAFEPICDSIPTWVTEFKKEKEAKETPYWCMCKDGCINKECMISQNALCCKYCGIKMKE